ncbi:Hypothetical predicted protein [Paramuricea clavata]|uniref:Uncharacterized protein n=1 Tax=Paramuricea clavata TaxID=317549 RepID=A0A7D9DYJ9_PARCT|nr:Hypothetical predicted protein [Paramuricea clavata]
MYVARITCRRSREGFDLKFNLDCHWSNALYKGLDHIQYATSANKVVLNRDDLSVFRFDSMATSNECASLCMKGNVSVSTKSDYQQKYPCTLQTTSYNFTGTNDEGELCAGVVKGAVIHSKNPAQHAADLEMIEEKEQFQTKFKNQQTGLPKELECIPVDSGSDEAPCFEQVQFWWAKRHFVKPTRMHLVTSRHSGGSNLNRVELQNGCEVKARTNLLVPMTLNGLNCDESGKTDNVKLKKNISDAINVHNSRVDQASCGDTEINLFRGSDSKANQILDMHVKSFLSGTKTDKDKLKLEHPKVYKEIKLIWDIQNAHVNTSVPQRAIFFLLYILMETPLKTEQKQNYSKCSKCLAENPPGIVSNVRTGFTNIVWLLKAQTLKGYGIATAAFRNLSANHVSSLNRQIKLMRKCYGLPVTDAEIGIIHCV